MSEALSSSETAWPPRSLKIVEEALGRYAIAVIGEERVLL